MNLPVVRVLIAEDFLEWRRELGSILKTSPSLQIVGEAENGLEAVQKTADLKPDLVLLDIGLPILNGIEVARKISGLGRHPKIIFVSENRSWDIAEEAFGAGGRGYVPKSQVRSELLPAINAVLEGEQFVSESLRPHGSVIRGGDEHQLDAYKGTVKLSSRSVAHHQVAFYKNDSEFEAGFAQYVEAAVNAHKAVLLVASKAHRTSIDRRLSGRGIDVDSIIATGAFSQVDADEALSEVMINNSPDLLRCQEIFDGVMRNISILGNGRRREVAICGECAPRLLMEGKEEAALELERHWDTVTRAQSADSLCGYSWGAFADGHDSPLFQRICAEHSAVHTTETRL
jgi:DNA-binding NarL/FixJ family response regulator